MSEKALYTMAGGRMPIEIGGKRYMARKLRPSDIDCIKGEIIGNRKDQRVEIRDEIPAGPEQTAMLKELIGDVTFADIGPYAVTTEGMAMILWLSVRRDKPDAFKDVDSLNEAVEMAELTDMMHEWKPLIFGSKMIKKLEEAQEESP